MIERIPTTDLSAIPNNSSISTDHTPSGEDDDAKAIYMNRMNDMNQAAILLNTPCECIVIPSKLPSKVASEASPDSLNHLMNKIVEDSNGSITTPFTLVLAAFAVALSSESPTGTTYETPLRSSTTKPIYHIHTPIPSQESTSLVSAEAEIHENSQEYIHIPLPLGNPKQSFYALSRRTESRLQHAFEAYQNSILTSNPTSPSSSLSNTTRYPLFSSSTLQSGSSSSASSWAFTRSPPSSPTTTTTTSSSFSAPPTSPITSTSTEHHYLFSVRLDTDTPQSSVSHTFSQFLQSILLPHQFTYNAPTPTCPLYIHFDLPNLSTHVIYTPHIYTRTSILSLVSRLTSVLEEGLRDPIGKPVNQLGVKDLDAIETQVEGWRVVCTSSLPDFVGSHHGEEEGETEMDIQDLQTEVEDTETIRPLPRRPPSMMLRIQTPTNGFLDSTSAQQNLETSATSSSAAASISGTDEEGPFFSAFDPTTNTEPTDDIQHDQLAQSLETSLTVESVYVTPPDTVPSTPARFVGPVEEKRKERAAPVTPVEDSCRALQEAGSTATLEVDVKDDREEVQMSLGDPHIVVVSDEPVEPRNQQNDEEEVRVFIDDNGYHDVESQNWSPANHEPGFESITPVVEDARGGVRYMEALGGCRWFWRMLGVKMGTGSVFEGEVGGGWDLLEVEEGARLRTGTRVAPVMVENGSLVVRKVKVGKEAEVYEGCALVAGAKVGGRAKVKRGGAIQYGVSVPGHATVGGSPLCKVYDEGLQAPGSPLPNRSKVSTIADVLFNFCALLFVWILGGIAWAPSFYATHWLYTSTTPLILFSSLPLLWLAASVVYTTLVALVTRISAAVCKESNAEWVDTRSFEARRLRLIKALVSFPLLQVFLDVWEGSILCIWFYRTLGARIGRNTFLHIHRDSLASLPWLTVGDNVTMQRNTRVIPEEYVSGGKIRRRPIAVDMGAVVRESCILSGGAVVGTRVILEPRSTVEGVVVGEGWEGSSWAGSPARWVGGGLELEESGGCWVSDRKEEGVKEHGIWMLVDVILRLIVGVCLTVLPLPMIFSIGMILDTRLSYAALAVLLPAAYSVWLFAIFLLLFFSKWVLIGKLVPKDTLSFFSFNHLCQNLFESLQQLSYSSGLSFLGGSDFAGGYWTLMGSKVGVDVYIPATSLLCVDYDLITIQDGAVLNNDAVLSGTSFGDSKMSFAKVHLGTGSSAGIGSVVLAGGLVEAHTILGAATTVLEGESVGIGIYWEGTPAAPYPTSHSRSGLGSQSTVGGTALSSSQNSVKSATGSRESATQSRSLPWTSPHKTTTIGSSSATPSKVSTRLPSSPRKRSGPQNFLLTGSTGFIGAYLLSAILTMGHNVFCLVRSSSKDHGMQRIRENLVKYGLWKAEFEYALTLVIGDLEQFQMGLEDEVWTFLAKKVDVVVHAAADVDYLKSYEELAGVNVEGTRTILDFAKSEKVKWVHYISTCSVFNLLSAVRIDESHVPTGKALHTGYTQSKYAAEMLVMEYAQQGLPTSIYRLGRITGDPQTGVIPTHDIPFLLLHGLISLGSYPIDLKAPIDILPVTYAVSVISHFLQLSLKPISTLSGLGGSKHANGKARVYHITHPNPTHLPQLALWLIEKGYELQGTTYTRWRQRLLRLSEGSQNPLAPFIANFEPGLSGSETASSGGWARFSCARTLKDAVNSGFRGGNPPEIDSHLVWTFVDYLIAVGALVGPTAPLDDDDDVENGGNGVQGSEGGLGLSATPTTTTNESGSWVSRRSITEGEKFRGSVDEGVPRVSTSSSVGSERPMLPQPAGSRMGGRFSAGRSRESSYVQSSMRGGR
ncbi:hypothetical protein HDV05_005556 [Chytridiales sp. JEL 0842]|nr:hypothetical protein HDV05_005556 [Chytridiales sp. JEL 0842]